MAALADGDRSAFDVVYRLAWPRVRAVAVRAMGNDPEAEDVAQQALLAVFERASEYDPARPALPWMLGITGWTVRTHRRRSFRRREVALDHPMPTEHPEAQIVDRDLWAAIHTEIGQLSALDRETLTTALDGSGSGPTFRKRLQRALERLKLGWRTTHGS